MQSKAILRKVGVGLKRKGKLNSIRQGWRLTWWGSIEKKQASHLLELRRRHQYSDQRSNRNRAPCVASTAARTDKEEDQMVRLSASREQLTEKIREAGSSLMKKKRIQGQKRIFAKHLDGLERSDFCDFGKPRKRICQKGKIKSKEQSNEEGQLK